MLLSNGNTGQTFSLCLFPHWKHYYVCSVKVKAIKAHSTEICFEQPLKSLEHNKIYREKTSRLIKCISECNSEDGHNDFSMQSIIYTLCWSQYPPPAPQETCSHPTSTFSHFRGQSRTRCATQCRRPHLNCGQTTVELRTSPNATLGGCGATDWLTDCLAETFYFG